MKMWMKFNIMLRTNQFLAVAWSVYNAFYDHDHDRLQITHDIIIHQTFMEIKI